MGTSRSDLFTPDQNELARTAAALGHPARIAILQTLAARGTCVCGEIVEVMGLAQSTVSQHLKVLREAGLVKVRADAQRRIYSLEENGLEQAESWLQQVRQRWNQRLDRLEQLLREEEKEQ